MATNISISTNWDTTFWNGAFQTAYVENNKLTDNMFNYVYQKGTNGFRFKTINTAAAVHTNSALSGASTSETGASITVDNPLVVHDYLGYDQMNVNQTGTELNTGYAAALATKLANARQALLLARLGKDAVTNSKTVTFDDEASTLADKGAEIFGALASLASTFIVNGIPEGDRYVALHPTWFYALRAYAPSASRDYVGIAPANEASLMSGVQILGWNVMPIYGPFLQDNSSNTNWASSYRWDATVATGAKGYGVAWHKNAFGVFESEKPSLKIDDSPENQAMLFTARCQFGTKIVQSTGCYAIVGD